jgi:hypothetical protein
MCMLLMYQIIFFLKLLTLPMSKTIGVIELTQVILRNNVNKHHYLTYAWFVC